jgi:hypothetical protein
MHKNATFLFSFVTSYFVCACACACVFGIGISISVGLLGSWRAEQCVVCDHGGMCEINQRRRHSTRLLVELTAIADSQAISTVLV